MIRVFLTLALSTVLPFGACAQELFVYNEPASNMPARSLGVRLNNTLMDEEAAAQYRYQFQPELMWGVNKNLMVHAEGFFSNRSDSFRAEGAGVYAKYRFFSKDNVYRHFRMAAFGRYSRNDAIIHYQEIETNGMNSGYEIGLIATQLLHKQAISASISYERAFDNDAEHEIPAYWANQALNLSLSTGRLILPVHYKDYRQTNFNIMAEAIGQLLPQNGKYYLDFAPSVQLIFNSQTRVDLGYRFNVSNNMERMAPRSFLVRVEHVFFNLIR